MNEALTENGWRRRTWSERAPVCAKLPGCITLADGRAWHTRLCPLHDRAECGSCA